MALSKVTKIAPKTTEIYACVFLQEHLTLHKVTESSGTEATDAIKKVMKKKRIHCTLEFFTELQI